jgi:hypothetical protein
MGWIDAMGPEVDRIGKFLRHVTRVTHPRNTESAGPSG